MKNRKLAVLLLVLAAVVFATMLIIKSYNPSQKILLDDAREQAEIAETRAMLGEAYMQMNEKNFNSAEKTLHLLLRKQPNNISALMMMGNVLCSLEKYNKAEEIFRKLIKLDQHRAINYNNLGQVLAMQGKHHDALIELKKAVELDPSIPHPHLNLSEVYIKLNRPKNAIAELKKAFELEKKNKTISINLEAFDALKEEKEFQELIRSYVGSGGSK